MKRIFAGVAAVLALAVIIAVSFAPGSARAGAGPNGGAAQSSVFARQWESLNVAAGAVINSPVFDLYNTDECEVVADNSAGGSTRNIIANWLGSDGTTVLYSQSVALTTTLRGIVAIGVRSSTASLPTGVTVIPAATGRRMSFSLSSAGAAAGSLAVYCR